MITALWLIAPQGPAGAQPSPGLEAAVRTLLATRPVPYAALGMVVADADTGDIRLAVQSEAPMVPASVMKLATSAVALRALGPDFRFVTRLVAGAGVTDRAVRGDLVLVGGGDPTLTRQDLVALARGLRARGVERVEGDLVVDASEVAGPGWSPGWSVDDLLEAYAPPVSALNLDSNVRTETATPSPRLVPDPDPVRTAGEAMRAALVAAGVPVTGAVRAGVAPGGAVPLAEHASAPLATLLGPMNKESQNLVAESLFRRLDAAGQGRWEGAAQAVTLGLSGIGVATEDVRVVDGSGLSRYDLLTPRAIARLLVAMHESEALYRSLPVAGVDGTLAHRFQASPVRGRLHAKTGTMSGVSAVAGYLEGTRGHRWVVTILVNGFTGSVHPSRRSRTPSSSGSFPPWRATCNESRKNFSVLESQAPSRFELERLRSEAGKFTIVYV